ncbi:MAG: transposase, partial [Thermoplasmata archaeon]|nr:transposase [Thermoplasmata archaeon]
SSRYIRSTMVKELQPYLWGDSFWSDGYFYESVGRVTSKTIKFYIERQQGKHWTPAELDKLGGGQLSPDQTTLESFCN